MLVVVDNATRRDLKITYENSEEGGGPKIRCLVAQVELPPRYAVTQEVSNGWAETIEAIRAMGCLFQSAYWKRSLFLLGLASCGAAG